MSEFEKKLLKEIEDLKSKIKKIEGEKEENPIPSYQYSRITDLELRKVVKIKRIFEDTIFDLWLNNKINLEKEETMFLKKLLEREKNYIKIYSEEDLKIKFITPILNKIHFRADELRDFYEEKLLYQAENFIFKGKTDFLVSKGYKSPEKPYFFIQEFKKSIENSDPEPQLLAELISAVELSNWTTIKGAYIVGENWSFVILKRLERHKYQYFVSKTFNSTNIEDLKGIYKNLLFVKQEITEMIENGI